MAPNGNCVECPLDFTYDATAGDCKPCPEGTWTVDGTSTVCKNEAELCLNALKSSFLEPDATAPNPPLSVCPNGGSFASRLRETRLRHFVGKFSLPTAEGYRPGTKVFDQEGAPRLCEACEKGTFSSGLNSKSCRLCPDDSTSEEGSSECTKCPNGTILLFSTGKCVVPETGCEPGEAVSPYSVDRCEKDCGNGRTPPFDDERLCEKSIFTVRGCDGCDICPDGKVRKAYAVTISCVCSGILARNRGLDENGKCVECPPGYYGPKRLRRNMLVDNLCKPCPPGTYWLKVPEETLLEFEQRGPRYAPREACVECPVNSFTNEEGQIECKKCPEGTFTYSSGSKECMPLGIST